ncbi:hypothetical protein TTHERM_00726030 (macronuclear) [Tetrahymena thermophila SB210]|uniref:Uncharacterized protein n=1 Tax=Tetrahymena thermophila (strain SB210) TaxID=312017 RepID=Q24GI7_TETTS|nr:hypothetical protein TTHERM_00726030 [Tetrahymena thermophila SB210]EAS06884.2 hypothetical protein TTHERM_00726030 [Tetrahymena thermophila SB210]|eukprot:XP_001027126.2 hypothetical protein TTHERM_00726030 [Tetrahymena thermophila SB210]
MDFNEQSYYKTKHLDISKDDFKTILEVPSQGEVVRFIEKYQDPDKFIKISQNGRIDNLRQYFKRKHIQAQQTFLLGQGTQKTLLFKSY